MFGGPCLIETGEGKMAEAVADDYVVDVRRDRLVIFASTLGTVFEWYDFFIYGTLAAVIGKQFFPTGNETAPGRLPRMSRRVSGRVTGGKQWCMGRP